MNLLDGLTFIKKLILQIASGILLLVVFIFANIHNLVYSSPLIVFDEILLNTFVMSILLISIIINALHFYRKSNHHIITFDIIFLFSEMLLILFHKLKDPGHTSAREII